MIIHSHSLSKTVDSVNEAFFFGTRLSQRERTDIATWIAARQALPGAYGQLFSGFRSEQTLGIRVFTGERTTSASARHILGEESCRAPLLLDSNDARATAALMRATEWMIDRVEQAGWNASRIERTPRRRGDPWQ
jgi:hypothetical protein